MSLVSSLSLVLPKGIFCSFFLCLQTPLLPVLSLSLHDLASSVAEDMKPSGEGSHQPASFSTHRHKSVSTLILPSCYEGNNRPCLCHGNFSNYPLSCNMNAFLSPRLFPPAFKQNFFHLKICSLEPITTFSNEPISLRLCPLQSSSKSCLYLCFKFPDFPLRVRNLVPLLTLGPPSPFFFLLLTHCICVGFSAVPPTCLAHPCL